MVSQSGRGGDQLAKFVATKAINPFVSKELADVIKKPIIFRITKGNMAYGYEATILAALDAKKFGVWIAW